MMPICVWLNPNDMATAETSDAELNSLLAEVRQLTGEDWRIRETVVRVRWWGGKIERRYELFVHVGGPEFQVVNFYRPDRADCDLASINTLNRAEHVAAYLYGLLAGLQRSPIVAAE